MKSFDLAPGEAVYIACQRSKYAWTGLFVCCAYSKFMPRGRRACSFCNRFGITWGCGGLAAISGHNYFINRNSSQGALTIS